MGDIGRGMGDVGRGMGNVGRGMGNMNVKPNVDLPAQPKSTHAGPAGDGNVEMLLLGRGR